MQNRCKVQLQWASRATSIVSHDVYSVYEMGYLRVEFQALVVGFEGNVWLRAVWHQIVPHIVLGQESIETRRPTDLQMGRVILSNLLEVFCHCVKPRRNILSLPGLKLLNLRCQTLSTSIGCLGPILGNLCKLLTQLRDESDESTKLIILCRVWSQVLHINVDAICEGVCNKFSHQLCQFHSILSRAYSSVIAPPTKGYLHTLWSRRMHACHAYNVCNRNNTRTDFVNIRARMNRDTALHRCFRKVDILAIPFWTWASWLIFSTPNLIWIWHLSQECKAVIDGREWSDLVKEW
mmetsp:Transcript_120802/g.189485  ORF Transcript_120802/g.189485 Transcript_120802/m.189485 type:complete len:293 (+) Transcript_120802:201-1079(+)